MSNPENKFDISNRVFNLLVVFLIALIGYWSFRAYEIWNAAPDNIPHEITVEGIGKVQVTPDIAKITLGVSTEGKTSEGTVKENTQKINDIISKVKVLGVAEKDIKTISYYLNPKYQYISGKNIPDGYSLQQTLEISVRDFTKVGDVVAESTTLGANTIGGINFTIENRESAKSKARQEAVKKAETKAKEIAAQTGLKLGNVVSFYEYENFGDYGKGGGGEVMVETPMALAPNIQPGQQEVSLTVTLNYRVK